MKRILSILSIIILASLVMVACNRKPATADASKIQYSDTVGLADYQAWKAENERLLMQERLNQQNNVATTAPVQTRTRTVYRTARTGNTTASTQPAKKGWSKAAKGAVIGGAGGAVLGAVINKRNRVAGGVIGGVLGAGVGYGIGRSMDKKDGRN
jgi:hypothetical protein